MSFIGSISKTGYRAAAAALVASVVIASAVGAQGLGSGTTVFRGADLHTVDNGVISGGIMVVRDGKIAAIGDSSTAVPAGATVVDVAGQRIYPGFIHSYSNLGMSDIDSVRGSVDIGEIGDNNADIQAEVAVSADSIRLLPAMGGGVLYAHIVPEGGIFSGTSAVIRLEGWNWEDMTVTAPTALHLSFPNDGDAGDDEEAPESKAMKALNEAFDQAADYGAAREAGLRLDADRKLQRVLDVINGDLRLIVHADNVSQMEAAIKWTDEKEINDWILLGTTDAAYLAEELAAKKIPVLMETVLGIPGRDFESYDSNFSAPGKLAAAGVQFALTGQADTAFARNVPFIAGMAVAHGLDPEAAIRSISLAPAEILGVADQLGSLSVGKEASFFIANGDPLEIVTAIDQVWMRGLKVDFERDQQRQLWKKYRDRPTSP